MWSPVPWSSPAIHGVGKQPQPNLVLPVVSSFVVVVHRSANLPLSSRSQVGDGSHALASTMAACCAIPGGRQRRCGKGRLAVDRGPRAERDGGFLAGRLICAGNTTGNFFSRWQAHNRRGIYVERNLSPTRSKKQCGNRRGGNGGSKSITKKIIISKILSRDVCDVGV